MLFSCSKKVHPVTTEHAVVTNDTTINIAAKKAPVKHKAKEAVPNVITVNDAPLAATGPDVYFSASSASVSEGAGTISIDLLYILAIN